MYIQLVFVGKVVNDHVFATAWPSQQEYKGVFKCFVMKLVKYQFNWLFLLGIKHYFTWF